MLQERYAPDQIARCPHCGQPTRLKRQVFRYHDSPLASVVAASHDMRGSAERTTAETVYAQDPEYRVEIWVASCDLCQRMLIGYTARRHAEKELLHERLIWPLTSEWFVPETVPKSIANDFREACEVLQVSAKASAALSRRCLQALLREKGGTNKHELLDQIKEVLDSHQLPTHLAEELDAVRNIGNLAAHPIKSQATSQIVEVEPHEAELNLTVLEGLFEHYYVEPVKRAERRRQLDAKLAEAGKPPIKQPSGNAERK